MAGKGIVTVRAYLQPEYDPPKNRWHWTIVANNHTHSVIVARSVATFPTEHDANAAGKNVLRQLLAGELSRDIYQEASRG